MKNFGNEYTKKESDVLELITHLILTKPVAVKKLLAKHGIVFSFKPSRKDLINQIINGISRTDPAFINDLERLLAIHLENKGMEIMALESHRALFNQADEDEFLGGLIGGVAKGALGALGGLFNKKRKTSGGGSSAALAAANAARAKAAMDARMRQMEADRRRQQQEAERRRREAEERRRREEEARRQREREAAERRRREDEDRRRREEMAKITAAANQSNSGKSANTNMMIIGGIAAVVIIGGVVLFSMGKKPVVVANAA